MLLVVFIIFPLNKHTHTFLADPFSHVHTPLHIHAPAIWKKKRSVEIAPRKWTIRQFDSNFLTFELFRGRIALSHLSLPHHEILYDPLITSFFTHRKFTLHRRSNKYNKYVIALLHTRCLFTPHSPLLFLRRLIT